MNRTHEPMYVSDAIPGALTVDKLPQVTQILGRNRKMVFEPKFDGHRETVTYDGDTVAVTTKGGNDRTDYYPALVRATPSALEGCSAEVDGELVALSRNPTTPGIENRNLLQRKQRLNLATGEYDPPSVFYAFDLTEQYGESLVNWPFRERRAALEDMVEPQPSFQLCPQFSFDEVDLLLDLVVRQRLEGIVIKDPDARYTPGRRTRAMQRIKFNPLHIEIE